MRRHSGYRFGQGRAMVIRGVLLLHGRIDLVGSRVFSISVGRIIISISDGRNIIGFGDGTSSSIDCVFAIRVIIQ